MKKIENSFAVTGRIRRDAEIHLFEIVKVAHFSIVVNRIGKINEEKTFVSSVMKVEAWSKMEDRYAFWILQKDVLITVEGYFKPEEWTDSKSGEKRNRIVMVATKFYPAPEKEEEIHRKTGGHHSAGHPHSGVPGLYHRTGRDGVPEPSFPHQAAGDAELLRHHPHLGKEPGFLFPGGTVGGGRGRYHGLSGPGLLR